MSRKLSFEAVEDRRLLAADCIECIEPADEVAAVAPLPTLSIRDRATGEGDSGTKTLIFDVFRSSNLGIASVSYSTADGTAEAGSDYTATSGTIDWEPGEYFRTVHVAINGDVDFEADETFFVILDSPVNATIADIAGTGTIINDDAAPVATAVDAVLVIDSPEPIEAEFAAHKNNGQNGADHGNKHGNPKTHSCGPPH